MAKGVSYQPDSRKVSHSQKLQSGRQSNNRESFTYKNKNKFFINKYYK
jgi:hypothetical protein